MIWVTALVSHFHSDEQLDFDTATGLIIVAQQYDLPLFKDILQALTAGKRANHAENTVLNKSLVLLLN